MGAAARANPSDRGYDEEWAALRARYLGIHRYCQKARCGRKASHVDHIIAVALRPDLRLAWGNLRSLCRSCHNRRSMLDQHVAERRCTPACDASGMPTDPRHPWNNGGEVGKAPLSAYGMAVDSVTGRLIPIGRRAEDPS